MSTAIHKLKKILSATHGCGCRQKETDIIEPKPQTKTSARHGSVGDSAVGDNNCISTTFPVNIDAAKFSEAVSLCPKIQDSFAVVKESDNPYNDFRQSMLQMILEKEIFSGDDLQQLLGCFLQLNSPQFHEVIVRAFKEIWSGCVTCVHDAGDSYAASVLFH